MDAHEREARRLIAAGADPRRAGPAAAAHFGLPQTPTAAQSMAVGCLMGVLVVVAAAGILMLAFDLRVSSATALQTESSARTAVEAALSPVPQAEREAILADLVRLVPLLHDPVSLQLVRVLRTLTPEQKQALAAEQRLGPLLGATAALTEHQRTTLLAIIGDPHSVDLLEGMRTRDPASATVLDSAAVRLVTTLANLTDPALRSAFIYVVDHVHSGNQEVLRLITAYWYREPALMAALAAPSPSHEPRSRHAR